MTLNCINRINGKMNGCPIEFRNIFIKEIEAHGKLGAQAVKTQQVTRKELKGK